VLAVVVVGDGLIGTRRHFQLSLGGMNTIDQRKFGPLFSPVHPVVSVPLQHCLPRRAGVGRISLRDCSFRAFVVRTPGGARKVSLETSCEGTVVTGGFERIRSIDASGRYLRDSEMNQPVPPSRDRTSFAEFPLRPVFTLSPANKGAIQLLVSVRSPAEVDACLRGGADIIDIKDPSRGALGRAVLESVRKVVRRVGGRVALTAAWGELDQSSPLSQQEVGDLEGLRLIKLGTAGLRSLDGCHNRWQRLCQTAPPDLILAVVHYADWQSCGGLDFADSVELALSGGGGPLVIDTFDKQSGNLLSYYSADRLQAMLEELRLRGIPSVLAGSLRLDDFAQVLPCHPTVIAVRGAACHEGNRTNAVSSQRVAELRESIERWRRGSHP
jgi:(5-formylfuran-3-yl)methyl phosphate synthase